MTHLDVAILITACMAIIALVILIMIVRPWELVPRRTKPPKQYTIQLDGTKYFEEIDEDEVNSLVHDKLQEATDKAVYQFQLALEATMPKLINDVQSLHKEEVKKAFANYTEQFEELNQEAVTTFEQIHDDLMKRHKELSDGLDKRAVADYKFRMSVFDKRLDDIVSGYVLESLGSQVDLGAQLPYILGKIEENKDQIKRDMTL